MPKVEIYTSPLCGFCRRAKDILIEKGVDFIEHDVLVDSKKRSEMERRANGAKTVPQIFVDDRSIGGCDDLYGLEARGELDHLLGLAA